MFNEDKNKKTNLYKAENIKNLTVKTTKDLNEYKGIKNVRYLFNDNMYEGTIDIRYFFNEIAFNRDFYIENIKSKLKKPNNLVKAYTEDIIYMVDHINYDEKLEERPINLEDIRDKFIAYSYYLPFRILSKSNNIDLKKINIVSFVTYDDKCKSLKTKSRIMVKSLKILKMPLFLRFLRDTLKRV